MCPDVSPAVAMPTTKTQGVCRTIKTVIVVTCEVPNSKFTSKE